MSNWQHTLDIESFARERLGFRPNAAQLRALDRRIRFGILNCSRQWGKSTTIALRAVHHAFHAPGSLTVVSSPSARQSAEFVRKAAQFLRRLGIRPRGDGINGISLLLPNDSRIIGLPGEADTIRGFSNVSLLLIDEASRVPDELYQSLRPMTAACPGASIWLLSTPNGRQGFFYEEWQKGADAGWTCIASPATECPHIQPEYLDHERRHLPADFFRQEYLCEFTSADFAYFDPAVVGAAFQTAPENLPAQSRFYLGLDLGQARDYSAIAILERRVEFTGEIDKVTFERRTLTRIVVHRLERIPLRTSYPDVVARVRDLTLNDAYRPDLEIVMDSTGVGAAVRDMLNRAHLQVRVTGVTITGGERVVLSPGLCHVPRHDLLVNLRVLLEKQMLTVADCSPHAAALREELCRWGRRSAHDDLVFAVALAAWKAGGQQFQMHGAGPLPMVFPEIRK